MNTTIHSDGRSRAAWCLQLLTAGMVLVYSLHFRTAFLQHTMMIEVVESSGCCVTDRYNDTIPQYHGTLVPVTTEHVTNILPLLITIISYCYDISMQRIFHGIDRFLVTVCAFVTVSYLTCSHHQRKYHMFMSFLPNLTAYTHCCAMILHVLLYYCIVIVPKDLMDTYILVESTWKACIGSSRQFL